MAPLLLTHFKPRQRSILSTLFTATFLGAVVVVAFPCPARAPGSNGAAQMQSEISQLQDMDRSRKREEVILLMNQRGKRRFMEER